METHQGTKRWRGLLSTPVWLISVALLAAMVASSIAATAQDTTQDMAQGQGQPARAIRLSYVHGDVQLAENGQVTAQHAVVNTPLMQGSAITTGQDGRAEMQFEDGSVIRLAPNSSLTLKVLTGTGSDGTAQMDVERGLAYFELQGNGQAGTMTVDFGGNTVTPSGFTVLRVTDDTPPGSLAVFAGNAELDRDSGALTLDLHAGENLALSATTASSYTLSETIPPNSWDTWNTDRDQELAAEAQQSTAPTGVGANPSNPAWNDLDANGNWYNVPDQGYVWSPYEASNPNWDPYGNGNWQFTIGYGYTWASAYPWGYLPYSCGAWNYYGGFGWGWAPGFGGCTPWWGVGYYGGPMYGRYPRWYNPVHRPQPPPRLPHPGRPVPLIAVNRMMSPQFSSTLPLRNGAAPVAIGGHEVLPMRRPIPMNSGTGREAFLGGHSGLGSIGAPTGSIGVPPVLNHPGRVGYVPQRPGYVQTPQLGAGNRPSMQGGFRTLPAQTYVPRGTYSTLGRPAGNLTSASPGGFHPAPGGYHGGPAYGGGGYHGSGGFHGGGGSGGGGHR